MIERHVVELRKELSEKRLQDEEHRKQYVHTYLIIFHPIVHLLIVTVNMHRLN